MSYSFNALGLLHFGSALVAMITGMAVILMKKGTKKHIYIGYSYVFSMSVLNISALMIYDLFGGFGPFHFMALISFATVIAGVVPAFFKKPEKKWLEMHYEFMLWSVIGLYAAFWSETFTRFFRFSGFWTLVALATFCTVAIGVILLKKKKAGILERFTNKS